MLGDPRLRAIAVQAVALAATVAVLLWLAGNASANLARLGVDLGFGFLDDRAGFAILQTPVPYTPESTYLRAFVVGLLNTLIVAALGIVLATILGFAVGLARLSRNWLLSRLGGVYVEGIRNVPLLLQIIFWHQGVMALLPRPQEAIELPLGAVLSVRGLYLPRPVAEAGVAVPLLALLLGILASIALFVWSRRRAAGTRPRRLAPIVVGLVVVLPAAVFVALGSPLAFEQPELRGFNFVGGLAIIPELAALLLALTLYTAAFIAEVVRAGVLAVPRGQVEASLALGLSRRLTTFRVVIPQALRVIVPPLTNQYLNLIKNSSLAVAIGYPDLFGVFKNTVLNQTGKAIEVIAMTMAVYLAISLLTSAFMNWFNRRVALREQ